jgi:hypothetical protein
MSRSRRKTPVFGNTTAESDKWFKTHENRRQRRTVRELLPVTDDLPDPKKFGNPWASQKDGKGWWHGAQEKDMRK